MDRDVLKNLPGVDVLLNEPPIIKSLAKYNADIVKYCIRKVLQSIREEATQFGIVPPVKIIIDKILLEISILTSKSLKRVINATGIMINTNLGRAPFSEEIINETIEVLKGYNNLEFDLETGQRKTRYYHVTEILKFLTGAEDILVVNNNAAAVMMILRSFARDKKVIVSRGELIEIGGSFRLPDIMAASDCKMEEVGTTNKTRIEDYENAISDSTALLFKAHRSNYVIRGFTQEASLQELVRLGQKYGLPVVYDMGSGLLRCTSVEILKKEPDVKHTLGLGVDLITFSGDKLLGASQAGIIAGKKSMIGILKKEPILRAMRVGKTTLALLESSLRYYLNEKDLVSKNSVFNMLGTSSNDLSDRAKKLQSILKKEGIKTSLIKSKGYCGGGALPDEGIESFAVRIEAPGQSNKERSSFAEKMYFGLMSLSLPVVGILKKGTLDFDVLTIHNSEINKAGQAIIGTYKQVIE